MTATGKGAKCKQIISIIFKIFVVFGFLYLFICALGFLGDAFKLVGGKTAGKAFRENELLSNPVAGLMIGVLATVLLQSSSTTTSIIVTMVGSGIIPTMTAIPMVMGANIGTSVTNTLVALAQFGNREEFKRSFAGATVHDMFNWLTVLILLPLEVATHYLYSLTDVIINSLDLSKSSGKKRDILKAITKPFTSLVVKVNSKVIKDIAVEKAGAEDKSVLKRWCKTMKVHVNTSADHGFNSGNASFAPPIEQSTLFNQTQNVSKLSEKMVKFETKNLERCNNLLALTDMDDSAAGALLMVLSFGLIIVSLVVIVKLLNSMLEGSVAAVVKRSINANFPGKLSFLTGYVAILVGTGMTMVIQSSSVFTSILTPLVGVGVVSLDRMFPLTVGANIGTTLTTIMASLSLPADQIPHSLQVGLCHLFFNVSGTILFYPIPFMRKAPIGLAKMLGNVTSRYRWFSFFYIAIAFFLVPGTVLGLSLAGTTVLLAVGIPLLTAIIIIILINVLQQKTNNCLPTILRNWDFLPEPLHSLDPLDRVIARVTGMCKCCSRRDESTYAEEGNLNGKSNRALELNEERL
ncbi:sodium-dependent phosphate transport protein 2B-like [Mizuhopecten yessoensis]|uniref:sodium-dependent phosphate transport protein 2B-like n=1 Tax=Mizuhopecten yessoensis TaxID=6573 RepID=UPI000B45CE78|nr:sodium-dependent phosphate transport protein 2B-like [Mizuhopecten yessoensis]